MEMDFATYLNRCVIVYHGKKTVNKILFCAIIFIFRKLKVISSKITCPLIRMLISNIKTRKDLNYLK